MTITASKVVGAIALPKPPGDERLLDLPDELLNALPAAVYVCDGAGLIRRFNRKAVELWGRTPKLSDGDERFCGSWHLYRSDGVLLPHAQCPMAHVLRTGEPVRDQEIVIERPDGSRIIALANIVAVRDAAGAILGAVNCFHDITERKRAEEKAKLLVHEVTHRANNLLTLMNAMMRQTRADTVPDFIAVMQGRVAALARMQTRLARGQWNPTELRTLISEELAPFGKEIEGRFRIEGPTVPLGADAAQALAIIIHELATNALKYGALSQEAGRVAVDWTLTPARWLELSWRETGGPRVAVPDRQGFGTRAISLLARQLDGTVEIAWPADGLTCRLRLAACALDDAEAASAP